MDLKVEISKVNERLINTAINASLIFLVPTLGMSLLRGTQLGWQPIFYFHIGAAILVLVLFFFKKKLNVRVKGVIFLSTFLFISLAGCFFFKLTGGIYMIFVATVIGTLVFGIRGGITYLGIFLVLYSIIAWLHLNNLISNTIDFNLYFSTPTAWIANSTGYLFSTIILIYTINFYNKLYRNSVSQLIISNESLNQTNQKLHYSEERFRKFFENYPYPISIKDESLKYVFMNHGFEYLEKLQIDENEMYDTSNLFSEGVNEKITALDKKVFETNTFQEAELEGLISNNMEIFFRLIKFPLEDIEGNRLLGTITIDITNQVQALRELEISEKKYRSIIEGNVIGFLYYDNNGAIIDCNNSLCILLGYQPSELIGMNLLELIPERWMTNEHLKAVADKLERYGNTGVYEKEFIGKDGKVIPVEINIHKQDFDGLQCFGAFVRDISEKKDFEQKLFEVTIQSEEKERERYARELHDVLGPFLSTSMIYIHSLQEEKDEKRRAVYLSRVSDLLTDAHKSIREISNNFSPDILKKYGVVQAVRSFVEKLNVLDKVKFSLKSNLENKLPAIKEVTLFRCIIELINNSIKYAECTEIIIAFELKKNTLLVNYADNGIGFNYSESFGKGFGLINVTNRITLVGGTIKYITAPGAGVNVSIRIEGLQA